MISQLLTNQTCFQLNTPASLISVKLPDVHFENSLDLALKLREHLGNDIFMSHRDATYIDQVRGHFLIILAASSFSLNQKYFFLRISSAMLPKRLLNIFPSLYLVLCSLVTVIASNPSAIADSDLICHTDRAAECYPRIFQPTTSFQIVHDDQDLPAGLHIRMNLTSGVKEAKLNEPDEDPVGHAADLVIVDDLPSTAHELQDQTNPQDALLPLLPHSHELQDQTHPQDAQLPRLPYFESSEGSLFASGISTLKSSPLSDTETLIPALSDLQDLAHSAHWGLTVTRDSTICRLLLQLLSPSFSTSDLELRSAAALLLGTAIHNNPPALTAALTHFYNDEWPNGPLEAVIVALAHEQLPSILARMVFLLSGLCQDEAQMRRFLDAGGLDLLAKLFDAENAGVDERDRLRGKIANFIFDNFMQIDATTEDFGTSNQNIETDANAQEFQSYLDKEEPWVNLEAEDAKPVNAAKLETNRGNLERDLKPWFHLFEKSINKIEGKNKSETNSMTAGALENIHSAHLALKKKLKAHSSFVQDRQTEL